MAKKKTYPCHLRDYSLAKETNVKRNQKKNYTLNYKTEDYKAILRASNRMYVVWYRRRSRKASKVVLFLLLIEGCMVDKRRVEGSTKRK